MRHCLVSDTSTEGIFLFGSSDVLFEKNIFRRNNIEKITGYFPAALKIFNQCYRVTCRDNLVIEQPNSNGIWYDVGNVDGVFIDNWIQGVGNIQNRVTTERLWPSDSGFFFEISKGAICAGNVFVNCDQGIRVLNSSNVKVYNNTLINSTVFFGRTDRTAVGDQFGWHPSTGPDIEHRDGHVFVGNLLVADDGFRQPLLRLEQTKALCGRLTQPQVKQLDDNVYVRRGDADPAPLIVWSPAAGDNCTVTFDAPAELQKLHPEFEAHSRYFSSHHGAVLQSPELRRYELLPGSSIAPLADALPAEVRELLGWPEQQTRLPGAYPLRP